MSLSLRRIPPLVVCALTAVHTLAAQARPVASPDTASAVSAAALVVRTARAHLDAERYTDALRLTADYLKTSRIPRRDRVELLQIAAVAAWPSASATAAGADSAKALLRQLVTVEPEASLYPEYRWAGLDSLLTVARATTFGAAVRWQSRYELVGSFAPATFEVVATRPVRARLAVQRRGVGELRVRDTVSGARGGMLRLFAHNGREALVSEGNWLLQVVVTDATTGDSLVLPAVQAVAEGTAPTLMPTDAALDTTLLLPELQPPARVTGIGVGLLMAAASVAIASSVRAPTVRDRTGPDRRALSVGLIGGAGAVLAGWFDRGRPLTANIARNKAVRDEYAYRTRFITAFNQTNVANFRVRLTLDPETR